MRVAQITPWFYPALTYGGPARSVYELSLALARSGQQVRVLTTDANGADRRLQVPSGYHDLSPAAQVCYCQRDGFDSVSKELLARLPQLVRWADVVHLQLTYSFPTLPTLLTARLLGKPVVWSPRGALQRWQGTSRRDLKALWECICQVIRPGRLALHTTSQKEADDSAARIVGARSAVIGNGVVVPVQQVTHDSRGFLQLLFVGRLNPIKALDSLLEAVQLAIAAGQKVRLDIAGVGEADYTAELKALAHALGVESAVRWLGFVDGEQKAAAYLNADVVVVPSHSENFGIVVAEGLAYGLPVITSHGTPWQELESEGCGHWVDNDPKSLALAINTIAHEDRAAMGARGRRLVMRKYSWDTVAQQMIELYQSLAEQQSPLSNSRR